MKVIRKKTRGKMCGLTILVMVLQFFGGISFVSVIAYADEVSVQVPYVSGFTSDSVYVEAVSGQEYIIVESGETPDWSKAMITDEGYLVFEDLTPATEYTVYTRVKKTENIPVSESVKTNVLIMLNGYETQGESKTGETITIIPDPENTEGLTWQWYYAQENVDGVVEKGEAIEGATSSSYVVKEFDVGKYLYFVINKGGKELEQGYYGPVRIAINPTVKLEDWVYGDNPNTPVVTGNTGNGAVSFTYSKKGSDELESETVPTMPGSYTVYVYIEESGDYAFGYAEADFSIVKKSEKNKPQKSVTGVTADIEDISFTKAGETAQINVNVLPVDADNKKVTFTSGNPNVATVDADGKITAVNNGTATITVTTEDGNKTATVKVTVAIPNEQQVTTVQPKTEQPATEQPAQEPTKKVDAAISINAGLKITQIGKKISIEWGKVKEADGYDIYVAYCGKKYGSPIKNVNKNNVNKVTVGKIKGKNLNIKKNFKVYIEAYKMIGGQKEVLAKSITGHVVGIKNAKYTNAKKITVSKKKYTVKVGKTVKIKAKTVLVDKKKKQLSNAHATEFRYASADKSIATVDKKGRVTGVSAGTTKVYVYSRNGLAKEVKVTVK